MLSKLRIGPKLLLAPCTILLLMIVVAAASWLALQRQNASLDAIVGKQAQRLRETAALVHVAQRAHTEVYQLHAWLGGSFATARIAALQGTIAADQADTAARLQSLLAATRASADERRLVQQAASAHGVYLKAVADVIELARPDASTSASAMQKAEAAFATVAARLAELSRMEQSLSEQAAAAAARDFARQTTILAAIVALSVVLALAITIAVRRALLREVAAIGEAARDLASGSLQARERHYGNDEIAATTRLLDTSIRHLHSTFSSVLAAARAIDSASRRVAADNADLSRQASEHASSLHHTASSVEELTVVVSQTASTARAAHRLALGAASVAGRGSAGTTRLLQTMGSLRRTAAAAAAQARRIDALASRAGVLARDAAAGAGLAGGHGTGMAQVAEQMGELSRQSSQAAREVADLMVVAIAGIDGGSVLAGQTGDSIADVARHVAQVGQLIDTIGSASGRQASGIGEVSAAIVQMDHISQTNCAMVTAAARAAAELQRQAGGLAKTVAGFNLDGAAGAGTPSPSATTTASQAGSPGPFNLSAWALPRKRARASHLRLASSRS